MLSAQPDAPTRMLGPLGHFGWSVVVGVVAALAAVVFRGLIALFHNLLFLGHVSMVYDANVAHAGQPLGAVRDPGAGDRVPPGLPFWSATSLPRRRGTACPRSWTQFTTRRA